MSQSDGNISTKIIEKINQESKFGLLLNSKVSEIMIVTSNEYSGNNKRKWESIKRKKKNQKKWEDRMIREKMAEDEKRIKIEDVERE